MLSVFCCIFEINGGFGQEGFSIQKNYKNVLLIGPTGSGKSSLANFIFQNDTAYDTCTQLNEKPLCTEVVTDHWKRICENYTIANKEW